MTDYFEDYLKKPALTTSELSVIEDNPRTDLLLKQYKLTRDRVITSKLLDEVDSMYIKWCDLLITGFNIVVYGPQSKFALLETFKRRYLDSGRLPDWLAEDPPTNGGKSNSKSKPKSSTLPMLNITTVRLHGLDPIKAEAFNHAVLGIKETRRVKDIDFRDFKTQVRNDNMHYIFLIHSFDRFLEECDDICETIFQLYHSNSRYVHLVLSTDSWNAGKKIMNLKYSLKLICFAAPLYESYFREKFAMIDNQVDMNQANETTLHRLLNDKVDLQSLKDIHLAIDSATQYILVFIMRDFIDKHESNHVAETTDDRKRFQARDAEDDEERELGPQDTTRLEDDQPTRRLTRNRAGGNGRASRAAPPVAKPRKRSAKSSKVIQTSLEFDHLLRHCESKFILRRSTALRDHLGELKDHKIITEDDLGNIQCVVDVITCKRFIEWVDSQVQE